MTRPKYWRFDPNHPPLVAVSGVRDLGLNSWDTEDDGDER
jgi:hypothetical protein